MTASNVGAGRPLHASHAAELYGRISRDHALTQALFRQALQDPQGAVRRIVELGQEFNLPVTPQEVRSYVVSLEDSESKQWLIKARGGL
ncbi:hypothetical protein [Cyanobium sp. FACHB-13342]|uniref:hypothetical protein n=1 Tax=Cyanobium sp. FACHB-13342 TaxID=2692793 RepID=UPI0018F032FB|nr:hypothetical protein [Cyanobium sp. FACHB-13342]